MSHLTLVREAPQRRTPKKRAVLSDKEAHRVAIALRNYVRAMGSQACAAEVLGVHPHSVSMLVLRRHKAGPAFALKLARASGVPLERLLSGGLSEAGSCPTCGATGRTATS